MAKLQIFVLVLALSQVYGNVAISTLPGVWVDAPEVSLEAVPLPTAPEVVAPPCVQSIRAILEAILDKLPSIEVPRPLPIDPTVPEVERPLPEIEVEELPQAPVVETPCTACFQHVNSLLTNAEQVLAVQRLMRF